jgi:hypothetical protein
MSTRLARTLLALSLLASGSAFAAPVASVPLPPPPAGTALSRPSTSARQLSAAGKIGYFSPLGNGGDGAAVLEVEVSAPWRTTAAGVSLGWALELRSFLPSKADRNGVRSGATGLEVTPALRASVPLGASRAAALRTQLGVGAVARWTWNEVDQRFVGRKTVTGSEATALLRAGVAIDWAVRPNLSLAIEPVSLGFDLRGNADWIFAAGATYRL